VLCNISDLVSDDITEYEYCGRRGQCDFTSGTCYCIDGYEGSTCTDSTYAESTSNSLPGVNIHATGTDYIGDIFKLTADKSSSSDFTFMKIVANDEDLLASVVMGSCQSHNLMLQPMEQQFQRADLLF